MTNKIEFERETFVSVVALSVEGALQMCPLFGFDPARVQVVDAGLPLDPKRYKPGARRWRIYP